MRTVLLFFMLTITTLFCAESKLSSNTPIIIECVDDIITVSEDDLLPFEYFQSAIRFNGDFKTFIERSIEKNTETIDRTSDNPIVSILTNGHIGIQSHSRLVVFLVKYAALEEEYFSNILSFLETLSLDELTDLVTINSYLCIPSKHFSYLKTALDTLIQKCLFQKKTKRAFFRANKKTLNALETLSLVHHPDVIPPYISPVTVHHSKQILPAPQDAHALSGHIYSPSKMYSVHLTGEKDNAIRLHDEKNNTTVCIFTHPHEISKSIFSPNETILATVSMDTTITLWDISSQTCIGTITHPFPPCEEENLYIENFIEFSSDNRMIATAFWSFSSPECKPDIIIWDTYSSSLIQKLPYQGSSTLFFSLDNMLIGTFFRSRCKIWEIASGKLCNNLHDPEIKKPDKIRSCAFSLDNRFLATCSLSTIKIWDNVTMKSICTISNPGDESTLEKITFGRNAATIFFKKKSQIWYKTDLPIFTEASTTERYLIQRLWDKQNSQAKSVKMSKELQEVFENLPKTIQEQFEQLPLHFISKSTIAPS